MTSGRTSYVRAWSFHSVEGVRMAGEDRPVQGEDGEVPGAEAVEPGAGRRDRERLAAGEPGGQVARGGQDQAPPRGVAADLDELVDERREGIGHAAERSLGSWRGTT